MEDDAVTVDLSDVLADFVDRPPDETPCFVIVDHGFGDSFRLSFADPSNRFNTGRNSEALAQKQFQVRVPAQALHVKNVNVRSTIICLPSSFHDHPVRFGDSAHHRNDDHVIRNDICFDKESRRVQLIDDLSVLTVLERGYRKRGVMNMRPLFSTLFLSTAEGFNTADCIILSLSMVRLIYLRL
ncbi:hypothetical protein ACFQIA_14425 [Halalkalicoccus sp. GCM10025704]|uniref:hypothetical protein n=1 Tax=Halalkalicoccus salilacus TaxID=3117459 RepID=UPI002F96B7D1